MGRKQHTVHHYIPQCYLRNFTSMEKGIYTYNKKRSYSYTSPIDSVCAIDNFYRVADFNAKTEEEALSIECGYLANAAESVYGDVLKKIIEDKETWILDNSFVLPLEDKVNLAYMIAIQYLRMPHIREATMSLYRQFTDFEERIFKQVAAKEENNPDIINLRINKRFDEASIHAQSTFMNDKLLLDFCVGLSRNYWSILVSGDDDFYTSDFPIIVNPHQQGVRPTHHGLTQYGAEVSFPLTKDILLVVWEKEYFNDKSSIDRTFQWASGAEVRKYNFLRYAYARNDVYSFKNDFSMIDFWKYFNGGQHHFMSLKE